MILRRVGNKSKIAKEVQKYFPKHTIYVEPFFGAGGMFFNKPKAKYNIVNDLDSDVYNLFQIVSTKRDELEQAFKNMPIHSDLLEYWKHNREDEPIRKALRFLFLSNFTLYGKQDTITYRAGNDQQILLERLDETSKLLFGVQFMNFDFRKAIKVATSQLTDNANIFIYADSPYLQTVDTYSDSDVWTETDSNDLFDSLQETGCKFAMSEFNHPFILEQAEKRKLNVHIIGERQNLKNRRTEILVTNYLNEPTLYGWL